MHNPKESFLETVEDLKEIIWWNRSLTKWTRQMPNSTLFMNKVLDTKGPFLEKVDIPALFGAPNALPWREFADEIGIDVDFKDVLQKVLFRGENLPLYHHQGEASRLAVQPAPGHEQDDLLITVPTAAGKTESFLIPVLHHVVSERKRLQRLNKHQHRLKVLMVYPIKTLEIDQMNRIMEYLEPLNRSLEAKQLAPIRVGVWDGDTPRKVVNQQDADATSSVCVDDHARGLKCPEHAEEPLMYANSLEVKCAQNHGYNWVAATRDAIAREGVDILLTNPEALEHLLLHSENKSILQSDELAYIVIDEAHMWKGYSGTAFALQLKRLRHMYRKSSPRVILATATLANPEEFAKRLTGNSGVQVVRFKKAFERGNYPSSRRPSNFSEITPTDASRLFTVLMGVSRGLDSETKLQSFVGFEGALFESFEDIEHTLQMLQLLHLVEGFPLQLTEAGEKFAERFKNPNSHGDGQDVSTSLSHIVKTQSFVKDWTEHLCLYLPELMELLEQFGARSFVEEAELVRWLQGKGARFPGDKLLLTLLSLGRISEVIFDKYHFFLKPSSGLYYCQECQTVHTIPECENREHQHVYEMFACSTCHEPVLAIGDDYVLLANSESNTCACGTKLEERSVEHAFLHYSSFITYLLSKVTNKLDSRKLLVFGDGRQLIEHLADLTQDLDYSLVTDRMGVFLALQQSEITLYDWLRGLKDGIHLFFRKLTPIEILFGKRNGLSKANQADLENLRKSYLDRFAKMAGDFRGRVFKPALLSFTAAMEQNTEAERALMHHLIVTLLIKSEFRRAGADKYNEYAVSSLYNSLLKEFPHWERLLKESFDGMVTQLVQLGIRLEEHKSGKRETLKKMLIWTNENVSFANNLKLLVPQTATYCTNCYMGYPAALDTCPACGSEEVVTGNRLSHGGYLPTSHDGPYRLDHWATEIVSPALTWSHNNPSARLVTDLEDVERTIVLSHRSGVPQVVRSAIEDGFKKKQPTVNVVCATPTMELGIDIGNLDSIVQVGVPPTKSNYIQRTGRAGRRRSTPSVIFNIIRNENAIDGYFYENLSERFLNKELSRLVIPEPSEEMLRMHIQAEVLRYLNFYTNYYKDLYQLVNFADVKSLSRKNVSVILEEMGEKILKLVKWIFHCFDQIVTHLQEVFGVGRAFLEQQVDTLYHGIHSILVTAVVDRFVMLKEQYEASQEESIKEMFIEQNRLLPIFLQNLGLFVSFRGHGDSVSVFDLKERTLEQKSLHYALREGFPGDFDEKNKLPRKGALWRVEARPFEIESVYVEEIPLTKEPVRICTNSESCNNPYEVYTSERDVCPVCGSKLESLNVYPYRFAFGRPMRSFGTTKRIKTNPILRTIVGDFE